MTSPIPIDVLATQYMSAVIHGKHLGLKLKMADASGIEIILPYNKCLIGNPETGGIHSGAITTLMDTCGGLAVLTAVPQPEVCPTLDLRMDFLRAAEPDQPIIGFAEAYHLTSSVVFTRGVAFHEDREKPLAHMVGAFMRTGRTFYSSRG